MDALLEKIRVNSIVLSDAHKERYVELKTSLKYYKIPVIIISGISSLISVAQEFFSQRVITICNGLFGLICSIIVSIELYLGISAQLAQSASLTKEFYSLSTDIFKTLSLAPANRTENSLTYLESTYGTYTSLCANSYIIVKHLDDQLLIIPEPLNLPERRSSTASLLNYFTGSPSPNRRATFANFSPFGSYYKKDNSHRELEDNNDEENDINTIVPSFYTNPQSVHRDFPVPHARFGESTDTSKRKSLNITTSPSPKDPTTAFPTSKVGVTHPSDTHTVSPTFIYRASELASGATGIPVQFPRRSLNLTTLPKHSSVIDILRNTSSQKTSTVEIPTPLHTSSYVSSGERSLNASISNSTVSSIKEHVDAIPVTIERSMEEEELKVPERRKASWVHDLSAVKFETIASEVEPLRSEKQFSTSGSDGDRRSSTDFGMKIGDEDRENNGKRSSKLFVGAEPPIHSRNHGRSSMLFVPTSFLTENHSSTFMSRGVNTMSSLELGHIADQNSESADEDRENVYELRSSEFEGFPPPAQQERALKTPTKSVDDRRSSMDLVGKRSESRSDSTRFTPNNGEQSSQLFILESQLE